MWFEQAANMAPANRPELCCKLRLEIRCYLNSEIVEEFSIRKQWGKSTHNTCGHFSLFMRKAVSHADCTRHFVL